MHLLGEQPRIRVCASESGSCICAGEVRFGFGHHWSAWRSVHGQIACTNANFGDVHPGQAKLCECALPRAEEGDGGGGGGGGRGRGVGAGGTALNEGTTVHPGVDTHGREEVRARRQPTLVAPIVAHGGESEAEEQPKEKKTMESHAEEEEAVAHTEEKMHLTHVLRSISGSDNTAPPTVPPVALSTAVKGPSTNMARGADILPGGEHMVLAKPPTGGGETSLLGMHHKLLCVAVLCVAGWKVWWSMQTRASVAGGRPPMHEKQCQPSEWGMHDEESPPMPRPSTGSLLAPRSVHTRQGSREY